MRLTLALLGFELDVSLGQTHLGFYIQTAAHRGDQGELLDTIAHEATHGACLILDSCGADYDGDSEPLAYLVAWLTRWLWVGVT